MIVGNIPNGWLVINKLSGVSSNFVNTKIKKHFGGKVKVGFAGTLDPLASGVLPIAIGKATKIMPFMIEKSKQYSFTIIWGEERTTDDAEGEVINFSKYRPKKEEILSVLDCFKGETLQTPPIFSAIKLGGKRACDRARNGENIEIAPRKVNIFDIKLLDCCVENAKFFIHCSKGTYVRSIARDLARKLGSRGYASNIQRLSVGQFTLDQTITLEKFLNMRHTHELDDCILPIDYALDDILAYQLSKHESVFFKQGRTVSMANCFDNKDVFVRAYDCNGDMVGIGRASDTGLVPLKVFV